MLVKLGSCWFDAEKVERISVSRPPEGLRIGANGSEAKPLPPGHNSHYVMVRTFTGSDTVIAYKSSIEEVEALADQLAEIVNATRSLIKSGNQVQGAR